MDEDQSLVFDVDYDQRPLPQSLPEIGLRIPLPPMPSTAPPSPPKSIMTTSYQNDSSLISIFPKTHTHATEQGGKELKPKSKKLKKKKRLKYCMNVPFFFRPFMNPTSNTNIYSSSSIEENDEGSDSVIQGYDSSSWVEEDYGITYTNNLYRNPNRGLGNSAEGKWK